MGIIIVAAWLGLILFAMAKLVKISLFSMDKLTIFIASWYYTHYYFSVRFSSGNAVYFWDVLAGILAVVIYSVLFKIIHRKLGLIGKILNIAISFISSIAVYSILASCFVAKKQVYLFPLLNHDLANLAVNYIIITIIAFLIWKRREGLFAKREESKEHYIVEASDERNA